MTYYLPASPHLVDHYLQHGILAMRSLLELEHPHNRTRFRFQNLDAPARTLTFDDPQTAADWWAGAYGTEIVILQIDGDVALEQNSPPMPAGAFFLEGEIPAGQIKLYASAAPKP